MGSESTLRLAFQGQAGPAFITPLYAFLPLAIRAATEIQKEALMKADINRADKVALFPSANA